MRRMLFAGWFLFTVWPLAAGSQSEIYHAYISSNMDLWKASMIRMEMQYKASKNPAVLYQLTEAEYGYIAFCLTGKHKKEAKEWLSKAEKNIEVLLSRDPEDPKLYSMKGALIGYAVALNPVKAPVLGGRSTDASDRAIELGPGEPRVWMERANMEFYKPAILGGSVHEAVKLYEKAVKLFEASPDRISENWLYLNCMANLGLAYEKTDRMDDAGRVYRKLLRLEPSFAWVKDDLYPRYKEKRANH